MFESATLKHEIDDATYAREVKRLRGTLLDAQYEMLEKKNFSVVVLVNGVDGAGKGETVNLLNEWLDPRHVQNHAFGPPTSDESERPHMWRYWQALPPNGKIGILFGSWYAQPVILAADKKVSDAEFGVRLERIRHFEEMLTAERVVLVKLWFHLTKKGQKKRFQELEADKLRSWRVTKEDWKQYKNYDTYAKVVERALRQTSTGVAPWIVIDGSDPNYRALTAGKLLHTAIKEGLEASEAKGKPHTGKSTAGSVTSLVQSVDTAAILRDLPFEERLSKIKYETKVVKAQGKLNRLSRGMAGKERSVVVVFEGMDAAGKGGAIRRVTQALDARAYSVIPIAAPNDEEGAHPYLWRFWRHLPRHGRFALFDRSWYGRVLVERVESYATPEVWGRAYREINEFEEQLTSSGIVVVKCWLAITKDEQLRRFKERADTKFKRYKITPDDWRNRKKWDAYIDAASDMIDRTSTSLAPWTIIEANDKHLARVRVLEAITRGIEARV